MFLVYLYLKNFVVKKMVGKYLTNFSWHIGDCFGGPPGYIYNLWSGLKANNQLDQINFNFKNIYNEGNIFKPETPVENKLLAFLI